jgi:hypothetical protein
LKNAANLRKPDVILSACAKDLAFSQSGKKVNRKVLHSGAKNAPPFRMTVLWGKLMFINNEVLVRNAL